MNHQLSRSSAQPEMFRSRNKALPSPECHFPGSKKKTIKEKPGWPPHPKTHRFPERNTAGHVTACVASRAKLPRAGAPPSSPIFVYPKHADATPSAQGRVALQSLCLPFTTCADVASRGGVRAKNALCIATLVCPPRPRLPSGEPDPQLPRAINALVEPLFLSSDSSHPATRPPPRPPVPLHCHASSSCPFFGAEPQTPRDPCS